MVVHSDEGENLGDVLWKDMVAKDMHAGIDGSQTLVLVEHGQETDTVRSKNFARICSR